jgi:hypothetical protein
MAGITLYDHRERSRLHVQLMDTGAHLDLSGRLGSPSCTIFLAPESVAMLAAHLASFREQPEPEDRSLP